MVLVGHSYGCLPMCEAARGFIKTARVKEGKEGGIVRMVFIASMVVEVGGSAFYPNEESRRMFEDEEMKKELARRVRVEVGFCGFVFWLLHCFAMGCFEWRGGMQVQMRKLVDPLGLIRGFRVTMSTPLTARTSSTTTSTAKRQTTGPLDSFAILFQHC